METESPKPSCLKEVVTVHIYLLGKVREASENTNSDVLLAPCLGSLHAEAIVRRDGTRHWRPFIPKTTVEKGQFP